MDSFYYRKPLKLSRQSNISLFYLVFPKSTLKSVLYNLIEGYDAFNWSAMSKNSATYGFKDAVIAFNSGTVLEIYIYIFYSSMQANFNM